MANIFTVRKYGAFFLCALLTTISFYVGIIYYNFFIAIIIMLVTMIITSLLASIMIKNPFSIMLEGRGLLCFNLDSTGVIRIFNVGLQSPYVWIKQGRKKTSDVWDRSSVLMMEAPRKNTTPAEIKKEGGIKIELDEAGLNSARFAFQKYPVLIWNDQIKSLVTKDFLAEQEKLIFAEHGILFLNRRIEDLTSKIRDFARYVVESTRPKGNIFQNVWVWVVIVVVIGILVLLFAPALITNIGSAWGTGAAATTNAVSNNPIIPR